MNMEQLQKHFDDHRDEIINGHEREYAVVSKSGAKHKVEYFDNIRLAVNHGAANYGYGKFAACHCIPADEAIAHFANL